MMKAFVIKGYGKQVALQAVELPQPTLGEQDVLVRIHAAGVNPLDAKLRDGEFKLLLPYPMPLILGHDLAGVVTQVGAKAQRFKVGDEVYGRAEDGRIGTFAEFIAVNEDALALKPHSLSMEEAASLPLVGLTAWQALVPTAVSMPTSPPARRCWPKPLTWPARKPWPPPRRSPTPRRRPRPWRRWCAVTCRGRTSRTRKWAARSRRWARRCPARPPRSAAPLRGGSRT